MICSIPTCNTAMIYSLLRSQAMKSTMSFLGSRTVRLNRLILLPEAHWAVPKQPRSSGITSRTVKPDHQTCWLGPVAVQSPREAAAGLRRLSPRKYGPIPYPGVRDLHCMLRVNAQGEANSVWRGVRFGCSSRGEVIESRRGASCWRDRWRKHESQPYCYEPRRYYSGNGDFGGGQHFPHSDQDSLSLFGGESLRRVIKPERIIMVRHGESLGNLDESTYVHIPDWKIPLTKKGFGDGQRAGEKIKEVIGDKPLFIYTSPYLRTKQTLAGMVEAFDTNYIVGVREEPRLTEQQFGNFQNLATIVNSKAERARFGRFYYRFPQGESGLDVYNRATSFIATMFRDFANDNIAREDLNVIIVTHGLTLRLLVMRWFQYSIADFEETLNPANGGFVVMERKTKATTDERFFKDGEGSRQSTQQWYELTPESRAHINFQKQQQFGSLWKLLSELPDEPGVIPDEHKDPRWED